MTIQKIIDGNAAAAEALRQINPEVVGAYPITPTSYIFEKFAKFVADGRVTTEFVTTESEHAAMSVCIGAAAGGGRTASATASQGLALMHEALFNASGMRLPILLFAGNRSLGAPLSIHGDHSDAYAERDTGWIQLFPSTPQEAYDLALQAFPIAETPTVRTPVMLCIDAFSLTHLTTAVSIEGDANARAFFGVGKPMNPLFDVENPVAYGGWTMPNLYAEHRRAQLEGLREALRVIPEVGKRFGERFGRDYAAHTVGSGLSGAKTVIVAMGTIAATAEIAAQKLTESGSPTGVLRIRTFRPFPTDEVRAALAKAENIVVIDRTSPAGAEFPPLASEIRSALYEAKNRPQIASIVASLGGRETPPEALVSAIAQKLGFDEPFWLGIREE